MQLPAELLAWLLQGDVAIQHQVHRDLLGEPRPDLQARTATEGWGARLLALRRPDGGLAPWGSPHSDTCVNGMFLNVAAWFHTPEEALTSVVDCLLGDQMDDGGFNCQRRRSGASHSSMHSTVSVLEGIQTWLDAGYGYRSDELAHAAEAAREFLLEHRLFRSHRTGAVIHPSFLRLSYPPRWRYHILRALDHFRAARHDDPRLADALEVLLAKRRPDGHWPVQAMHPGQTHFVMERAGGPSRWNTLRALRVRATLQGSDGSSCVPLCPDPI